MTYSIRLRLLWGIFAGMVILLIIFSFVIYAMIRHELIEQFDSALGSGARMIAAAVEEENGSVKLEQESVQLPEFLDKGRPSYYELWNADGMVAAKSPLLENGDLTKADSSIDIPAFRATIFKNRLSYRSVTLKFILRTTDNDVKAAVRPEKLQPLTLVLARNTNEMEHNLEFLRWLLFLTSAGIILLSFIVVNFAVGRGLLPLNLLATEIAGIREDNLTTRITNKKLPLEIKPIKERLNDMLERLEKTFSHERRFTSDVAHELRTPLAGIRSTIEVALTRLREQGEYQAALTDCLAIAKGMQTMVDNLLTLSRIDTNQASFSREKVMPSEIVNSCLRSISQRIAERKITFENRISADATCSSDTNGLLMVISNLLDNAAEYTNENGKILAEGRGSDNQIEITIANTGCCLTNDEVSQVFNSFWRGDISRTDTGTHCGLGLALVKRIIDALGGSVSAEVKRGGIFTIGLILPVWKNSLSSRENQDLKH